MTEPTQNSPAHIGIEIRQSVIPANLSVTEAAKMLGVGRPALSNLLNGKAALSPEMAMRLERVFGISIGISSRDLLAKQARYDEHEGRGRENQIAVRPYVPTYLQITAGQIAAWSETIDARGELAVLLRTLVHSTGSNLEKVDFPALDNSQREGGDGWVDSGSATPWIPLGTSCWEFSCNKKVGPKADADYATRTRKVAAAEQEITTFVFVTPRNWPKKEQWVRSKKDQCQWKDVRAFDASDLEQWLEQSIPAQVRFREFQGIGTEQVVSLDQIWNEWACVTEPELSQDLFVPAAERHRSTLEKWFSDPPAHPLIVSADSSREALAFLACTIGRLHQSCSGFHERAIIIRSRGAFNSILKSFPNFVAIIASSEVEQDLAGLHKKAHTIIVRERSTLINNADIALDPLLGHEDFRNALKQMGFGDLRIAQLAIESARSPSILRRRLSEVPAVQCPPWMEDNTVVRALIPLIFVGAWDSCIAGDQQILCRLTGSESHEVERVVAQLQRTCEPPIWSIGSCRGIVAKIDALYAASDSITLDDLTNFLSTAKEVLSEPDPALELIKNKRWAVSLYEGTRKHSSMLRQGICDTLVLMAVHGNALFKKRIGIDLEVEVSQVINHLLTPSAESTWLSQRKDLLQYAEAAPEIFLEIVKNDINSEIPKSVALFTPVESTFLRGCPRAQFLWALESLAWKPQRLMRVVLILAQLCEQKIDDNWANTPWATLASIFSIWPQTTATLDQRNRAVAKLVKEFPEIGWKICVGQFHPNWTMRQINCRPRWRTDAHEASQTFITLEERQEVKNHAIKLVLNWPSYNAHKLGDLVECLGILCKEQRNLLWDRIVAWNSTEATDTQRAALRERIRVCTLTRRSRPDSPGNELRDWAHGVYALLEPSDLVARHSWLFLQQWIEPSADEIEGNELDYRKRDKQIARQRCEALKEVWQQSELDGILNLCRLGEASSSIGLHLAEMHADIKPTTDFVQELLSIKFTDLQYKLDQCIGGFLAKLDPQQRRDTLSSLLSRLAGQNESCIHMLLCAPFDGDTWHHVDGLSGSLKQQYWREVNPHGWGHKDASDVIKLVDELLEVDRPRAAFFAAELRWELLDSKRLMCLLTEVAINDSEPSNHYQLKPYYISEALDVLEERGDTSDDELAQLEFMFIRALDHTTHGIRNLEAQLSRTPALFMQVLALAFKRNDGGVDPAEWRPSNSDHRAVVGAAAYSLLTDANRVPGTQADGSINLKELKKWLEQARGLARQYGRANIGDQMIGQFLSHCPAGEDGVWPCEPVRDVIEGTAFTEIRIGMSIGIRNSRGAMFRGEGGEQERQLADQYRRWSEKISFEYPYTSSLLEQIACSYDSEMEWWDTQASLRQQLED